MRKIEILLQFLLVIVYRRYNIITIWYYYSFANRIRTFILQ